MRNDAVINELQGKALRGDEEALEAYQMYVDKGMATPIYISTKNTVQHSQALMAQAYEDEATKRGDGLFDNPFQRELTQEEIMKADPATRIAYGYSQRAEAVAEHKAKKKAYRNSMAQAEDNYANAIHSSTFVEMFNDNK